MPTTLNPSRIGRGRVAANSATRRLAAEEVHRVGQRAPAGELERVERAVRLEHAGEGDALVEPEPAGHPVGHVELRGHRHRPPGGLAHRRHHLAGEARPVLEAPTPAVGAPVQPRAQERAEQVVVPEVDLDAVEPRVDHDRRPPSGSRSVIRAMSSSVAARVRAARGAEAPGRRERRHPVGAAVGDRTGVTDLGRHRGAVARAPRRSAGASPAASRRRAARSGGRSGPRARRPGRRPWSSPPPPRATRSWNVDQGVGDLAPRGRPLEGGRLDDPVLAG